MLVVAQSRSLDVRRYAALEQVLRQGCLLACLLARRISPWNQNAVYGPRSLSLGGFLEADDTDGRKKKTFGAGGADEICDA